MIISREEIYSDVAENNQGDIGGYFKLGCHGAASHEDETKSQTGKELGMHNPGIWKAVCCSRGRRSLAHTSNCQKTDVPGLSMMGRENDLGRPAKIMQSLSSKFQFYSE